MQDVTAQLDEVFASVIRTPMGSDDPHAVGEAYRALFPGGPRPVWVDDPFEFADLVTMPNGRYRLRSRDISPWVVRSTTFTRVMNDITSGVGDLIFQWLKKSPHLDGRRFWRYADQIQVTMNVRATISLAVEDTPRVRQVMYPTIDRFPLRRPLEAVGSVLWVDAAHRAGLVPLPRRTARQLANLATLYRHGLFDVMSGLAVFVRPPTIHRDGRMRLHRTDGPSIHWPGLDLTYHLQGVQVHRQVVESPTVSSILERCTTWPVLRPVAQNYGWPRLVREMGLRAIHVGRDEYDGTLYEGIAHPAFLNPGWGSLAYCRLLVGRNGSPNRDGSWNWYGFMIPADVRYVRQAHAALWGITPHDWSSITVRT